MFTMDFTMKEVNTWMFKMGFTMKQCEFKGISCGMGFSGM